MQPPIRDDDPARDRDDRAPGPSARVRLEVELLASDQPAALPALDDQRQRHTVLVVAADADVRRYVCECLRDRDDLRVLETGTIELAERLATLHSPRLLIVDAHEAAVLSVILDVPAVLIADDVSSDAMRTGRIVTLMPPFGGEDLEAVVDLFT
ncbi:MAG: hypothetical protein K0S86_5357 [Geminicoccaceae bacterium]|nr:hypothetical protein [Geminicoccaceae bacterium]